VPAEQPARARSNGSPQYAFRPQSHDFGQATRSPFLLPFGQQQLAVVSFPDPETGSQRAPLRPLLQILPLIIQYLQNGSQHEGVILAHVVIVLAVFRDNRIVRDDGVIAS
jgi:hypothetical protein